MNYQGDTEPTPAVSSVRLSLCAERGRGERIDVFRIPQDRGFAPVNWDLLSVAFRSIWASIIRSVNYTEDLFLWTVSFQTVEKRYLL